MAWAALLAVALFAPLLLLAPLTPVPDGSTWGMRLAPPASASLHGVATLLIAVATVSSVPLPELQGGLARLPLPSVVTVLVAQMAFQSRALADESRRVAAALAVRGATARRGAGWQVARSLPATWLPRVLLRAERVAAAMDVRGYVDHDPRVASREGWGSRDLAVVAVAGAVFTLALALRFGGAG
jgi:energy-coupling factor transporter transmembrane protein EcfT